MTKFTKKHYELVSKTIKEQYDAWLEDVDVQELTTEEEQYQLAIIDMVNNFSQLFRDDNKKFKSDKFWEDCGLGSVCPICLGYQDQFGDCSCTNKNDR